jgi:hypothetical protein
MVELVLIVVLTNQLVITPNSVIDYALISPTVFRPVIDFNALTFNRKPITMLVNFMFIL